MRTNPTPALLVGLSLVPLATVAAAQSPGQAPVALRSPFERLSDSGLRGVVTLAFDAADHALFSELHARGTAFELAGLPLPGGVAARLTLLPVDAMSAGARARVVAADGSVAWLAPGVKCFAGFVAGGGEAFLGITPGELHGYLRVQGELYFLSSGGAPHGRATLAHASRTGAGSPGFCALAGGAGLPSTRGEEATERSIATPNLEIADVFIEADNAYRGLFASDQACVDYSALLITAASEVYRRDVGARLEIPDGYLRVWTSTPPWGAITTFGHISNVQAWWTSPANPDSNLPRAAVHVLTTPVFGGVAWNIGGLCDNSQGYEVSSVFGHFPYPIDHTNDDNWDLFVLAHEFGHSFGCIHSFDFSPPITCQDGSGPDSGTIMSYCHLDFGVGGVGMRFHLREQDRIRSYVGTVGCLALVPLLPGDYDASGVRDVNDLLVANGVLAQGFRSRGAEETFDMDADGDFDTLDRDILAAIIGAPPASATERNGSGANEACLSNVTNPVLGTTWSTDIVGIGVGRVTYLLGYAQPHAGLATPFGELLVRTPALGGIRLFAHAAASDGLLARHDLAVPFDLALTGLTAATQGLVIGGPGGTHLCNALDVVLSPYE